MSEEKDKKEPVDITEFDSVVDSEDGYEFELENGDGSGTNIFIKVRGKHSDEVTKWTGALMSKLTREHQMAARKGKAVDPKSLEEMREQNIEGAAVRVIGWRNVKQPFDQNLLKSALRRNPHWIDQIVRESDSLGNFTKKQ